ncbi:hypothetical protein PALU110988_19580 [Paenibacillus lupini]|nr:hypothetical protein [Paenibacillus lupini]
MSILFCEICRLFTNYWISGVENVRLPDKSSNFQFHSPLRLTNRPCLGEFNRINTSFSDIPLPLSGWQGVGSRGRISLTSDK